MASFSIFSNPACGVDINCGDTFLPRLVFLFDPVWWSYPFKDFDNTGATYLTDYALSAFMVYGVYSVIRDSDPSPLRNRVIVLLSLYAISVFSGGIAHQVYVTPPTTTSLLDSNTAVTINTLSFKIIWSICVASVCIAGSAFGAIACELGEMFENNTTNKDPSLVKNNNNNNINNKYKFHSIVRNITSSMALFVGGLMGAMFGGILGGIYGLQTNTFMFQFATELNPSKRSGSMICIIMSSVIGIGMGAILGMIFSLIIPKKIVIFTTSRKLEIFWIVWALVFTVFIAVGCLSMLQPAADIFVAGFSQAFSTMHIAAVFICNYSCDLEPVENKPNTSHLVSPVYRNIFLIGLFLNMPLIVIYPLVLSYFPTLTLGFVNCCLHCCLATAWGMQWYSLKGYCMAYYPKTKTSSSSLIENTKSIMKVKNL